MTDAVSMNQVPKLADIIIYDEDADMFVVPDEMPPFFRVMVDPDKGEEIFPFQSIQFPAMSCPGCKVIDVLPVIHTGNEEERLIICPSCGQIMRCLIGKT